MSKKRGALQLSINLIVILIICIVIFTMSIYFTRKLFSSAEKIKFIYDERTEKEIERILDDGSRVAIPFENKKIYNGKFETFGIGILNIINQEEYNNFFINVTFNKAYDKRNNLLCTAKDTSGCNIDPNSWLKTREGNKVEIYKKIKNNAQEKFLLGVEVKNAKPGTYIFDLKVCVDKKTDIPDKLFRCPNGFYPYDYIQQLRVYVPS